MKLIKTKLFGFGGYCEASGAHIRSLCLLPTASEVVQVGLNYPKSGYVQSFNLLVLKLSN